MTKNTLLFAFCLVLGFMSTASGQNITPVVEWQKCFGSSGNESGASLIATSDGGFIYVGTAIYIVGDGDLTGIPNHSSGNVNKEIWVVKLSQNRTIQWQKMLGGTKDDFIAYYSGTKSIAQTSDGGYIVSGTTNSNDGDVNCPRITDDEDIWMVKLSATGTVQWQKCLGGIGIDIASDIIKPTFPTPKLENSIYHTFRLIGLGFVD